MSYYILRQDTLVDGARAVEGVPAGFDALEWIQGRPIEDPSPGKKLVFELSKASGDYRGDIIDGIITIFSDELKEALDGFGIDNVSYVAIGLHDQNADTFEGGYWLVNILDVLDCVDLVKSRTKPWVSGIGYDFLSMVIDASRTNDAKIFRLKDDPSKIVIRQDLKRHLEAQGAVVGVEFIETEDYSDW